MNEWMIKEKSIQNQKSPSHNNYKIKVIDHLREVLAELE